MRNEVSLEHYTPSHGATPPESATFGQASIFYADQSAVSASALSTNTVVEVKGRIEPDRLVQACRRLYAATAALRLRFGLDEWTGRVVYRIAEDEPEIEYLEVDGATPEAVSEMVDERTRSSFETDEGSLVKFIVVRTAPDHCHMALVFHHLVCDGAGHAPLARRFIDAVFGDIPEEDADDYRRLARRVHSEEKRASEEERGHWDERLPSGLASPEWDIGLADPSEVHRSGRVLEPLEGEHLRRLETVASSRGLRLFHLLVGTIHRSLPLRYGDASLLSVATSARPRDASGGAPLTGCFINQVPLVWYRTSSRPALDDLPRESSLWYADLARRNFPFADLADRVRTVGEAPSVRLDSVVVSYRKSGRELRSERDGLCFSADLYPRYLEPKTDISIRFFHHGGRMEVETQWGRELPSGLGPYFRNELMRTLRAT